MDTPRVQLPGPENSNSNQSQDANQSTGANNSVEVEMGGTQEQSAQNDGEDNSLLDAPGDIDAEPQPEPEPETPAPPKKNAGLLFLEFLTSPIVEIVVGEDEEQTVMTAHQTLLRDSSYLEEFVDKFEASGPRRIELPTENVEAFGCFLQFQYTHDYTLPSETNGSDALASGDGSGEELLRHARIYTLAEKLELPALKTLAHRKIHRVNSTPGGELAYARYVYTHTDTEDLTIRKPIAVYWSDQGHVLRHDLTEEFKLLCLEVPEFAYDVLNLSFDKQEKKRVNPEVDAAIRGSGRKRRRDI